MEIKHYIENTDLTLQQVANATGASYKIVWLYVAKHYSKAYRLQRKSNCYRRSKSGSFNPMSGKTAEQHHNYLGAVSDCKGYLLVLKPLWYTGRKRSKHIFQHHLVMCEHLNITAVPAGYVVHHCDRNPRNNDIDNLLMMSMAEHATWHASVEGATTISKESTAKWLEARRAVTLL